MGSVCVNMKSLGDLIEELSSLDEWMWGMPLHLQLPLPQLICLQMCGGRSVSSHYLHARNQPAHSLNQPLSTLLMDGRCTSYFHDGFFLKVSFLICFRIAEGSLCVCAFCWSTLLEAISLTECRVFSVSSCSRHQSSSSRVSMASCWCGSSVQDKHSKELWESYN